MDIVHDFNGEENGGESELTTSMVSHWNPTILDFFQCSSSISSMISHSVVKQTLFCEQEFVQLWLEFQDQMRNDLVAMLEKL